MAGRKEKHTIDYFPHYVNHKKTMHIIEQKYGNNGYAFWFKLLELLGKSEHHIYDMTTEESSLYFYSQVNTTEATGKEVLEMLARLNAIDQELYESGYIYSEKFCENIHDAYRKRSAEMLNKAEVIQLYRISTGRNSINSARNTQRKVKYSKVKEIKGEESKGKKNTIPPKMEWIEDYCTERKNGINPSEFFNHYQSKGWFIGKNKMKDWKACVHTWENKRKENSKKTNSQYKNYQESEDRDYGGDFKKRTGQQC